MTKAELLSALRGVDDNASVYLYVDGCPLNVECTEVVDDRLGDDEPIVILR
jgi:hypothetical protein